MKIQLLSMLFALSTFFSTGIEANSESNLNIGLASYALVVGYNTPQISDDEYTGAGISALYAISNNVAFRGTYYVVDHAQDLDLDTIGYDLLVYWGRGFTRHGFKAYIGGGYFNETQEDADFSDKFSGLQVNGGIGYNWSVIALDFTLGIRDPGDYEDFFKNDTGNNIDAVAITGSLILSARF